MNPLHRSLDETVAAIREQHATETQACKDRTMAAEVECALLKDHLAIALEARHAAERFSVKLLTQFSMVEAIFAEAKHVALAHVAEGAGKDIKDDRLPEVSLDGQT